MIDYGVEPLTPSLVPELEAIWNAYYATTPAHTGTPPYDFDWNSYFRLDALGILKIITARKEGRLVGFILYMVTHHLHHRTTLMGVSDGIGVDMTVRGEGVGRGLLAKGEEVLRGLGCTSITHSYRLCYGTTPLFEKLGFEAIEHVYQKRL